MAGIVICVVAQIVFIFFFGEFDLPCVDVVDQFVAVHEVDANNVVVELVDDVHRVGELLPLDV